MADRFNLVGSSVRIGNPTSLSSNVYTFDTTNTQLSISDTVDPTKTHVHVDGVLSCDTLNVGSTNVIQSIADSQSATIRLYVRTSGNDSNDGTSFNKAFRTIKHAVAAGGTINSGRCVVYVESGDYTEDNPIHVPPFVAIMGDNLRTVRIFPQNPSLHMFFINNGCYLWGLRLMHLRQPAFCVAFPCSIAKVDIQFGTIVGVQCLYSFSGYTAAPTIRIEPPETSTGTAPVVRGTVSNRGDVESVSLDSEGDVYPATVIPDVTCSLPDIPAIAPTFNVVVTGDTVTDVTIATPGSKYLSQPTMEIQAPALGTRATATAILDNDGYVVDVQVTGQGSGYNAARTYSATITPPLQIQATAEAVMTVITLYGQTYAKMTGVRLLEPGGGYSVLTVMVDPPASVQATAQASLDNSGTITSIQVTNPGSGYTNIISRPYVSIDPPDDQKAFITSSPYIQNCSSICGPVTRSDGSLVTQLPQYDLDEFDVDPTGAGGGCVIDGAVVSLASPLKSMCADSFTLVNQGGGGHMVINTGYGQFVSCFTTFCSYSYRAVGGGTMNISTSVSDFGLYGLVSSGYWPEPVATGNVFKDYSSTVSTVVVSSPGAGYTGSTTVSFSASTLDDRATGSVTVVDGRIASVTLSHGGSYESTPNITFDGVGAGGVATAVMSSPPSIRITNMSGSQRKPELGTVVKYRGVWHTVIRSTSVPNKIGEYDIVFDPPFIAARTNDALEFFAASVVSTGQHVMEHVGSGITYNALPIYGGVSEDAQYIVEEAPGRVFYCITDHLGNQRVGPYFSVEQLTGEISLNSDRFSLTGLEAIGPFKRNGIAVGVMMEEVSNDTRLLDSTGAYGGTTVPTQFAVKSYVQTRGLGPGGQPGDAYVKNSVNDFDASWTSVVLGSSKGVSNGVAPLDSTSKVPIQHLHIPQLITTGSTSFQTSSTSVCAIPLETGTYMIDLHMSLTVRFSSVPTKQSIQYLVNGHTVLSQRRQYNVSTPGDDQNPRLDADQSYLWLLSTDTVQTITISSTLVVEATTAGDVSVSLGPDEDSLAQGTCDSVYAVSRRVSTS